MWCTARTLSWASVRAAMVLNVAARRRTSGGQAARSSRAPSPNFRAVASSADSGGRADRVPRIFFTATPIRA